MFLLTILSVFLLASCAVRKHIPEGAYLYGGAKVTVQKASSYKEEIKTVSRTLKSSVFPQKNKMIFGYPYKVAFWYAMGETKKEKGFKYWLKQKFGEPPVYYSLSDMENNRMNLQAIAENEGYFETKVSASSTTKGYKRKNNFSISLPQPYTIDSVQWVLDSSGLSKSLLRSRRPFLNVRKGARFQLLAIQEDASRTDLMLKRRGYYFFNDEYLKAYIDTTQGDHKVQVMMGVRKDVPDEARVPQHIRNVYVFPAFNLLDKQPDTLRSVLVEYKGLLIGDSMQMFKPKALVKAFTYSPGSMYNVNRHDETLNRLMNMGVFKFVKSRYVITDTTDPRQMDVYYYLTPLKKKSIVAELGGFTKSNSFTGAQANVNWLNRNLLRGAERLNLKLYGAFEVSANDSLKQNNNWRLGTEISLSFPRFVTPFKINESSYFPPNTRFKTGYEWMRRQLLFTRHYFTFQYDLNWKENRNKEHTLSPVNLVYTKAGNFSQSYLDKVNRYPVLEYANLPELITSSFYTFTYSRPYARSKKSIYFNGSADVAGNVLGLFNKASTPFSEKFVSAYFVQYLKFETDFRFTYRIKRQSEWVNRVSIGAGFPYGNSMYLPFSRQFTIGGANSLRGFRPKQLGPGRVVTTADQQVAYPQIGGDYKLELQTEWRFPLFSIVHGAVFADAGNIWTRNDFLYGQDAVFTKNFMKDIAADAGVGLRFDLSILVIRLDLAMPLRKPWLPPGEEWIINEIRPSSKSWRKDNLVLNLGIGYPF